jgi:hypothetical protein
MVTGETVALAGVQGMFGPAREHGCRELLCRYTGPEFLCKSVELFFEDFCYLFCPCYQFYEEFPDHRSDQSGTVQDLNSDDPFGSMNSMSDEMLLSCLKNHFTKIFEHMSKPTPGRYSGADLTIR